MTSGCSNEKKIDESRPTTSDIGVYRENTVEISSADIFFNSSSEFHGYNYAEDSLEWVKYIENTFNIKLKVNSIYDDWMKAMEAGYNPIIELGFILNGLEKDKLSGLYRISFIEVLEDLIKEGLILPLDDYLKGNTDWESLPAEWREAFIINGQTWAVPSTVSKNASFRYIRMDWLNNLSMDMPTDVNEFHNILRAFTFNDPDMNDIDDTVGAISIGLWGMQDIFASFDARANYKGEMIPSWNPNEDIWEDSMLKPEMSECVSYLKMLKDEGVIIDIVNTENGNKFETGIAGSFFSVYHKGGIENKLRNVSSMSEPVIDIMLGLSNNIDRKILPFFEPFRAPYVVLNNTRNPSDTLNTFLNTFLLDKNGYILSLYGLPDSPNSSGYFRENDGKIERMLYEYENKAYPRMTPNFFRNEGLYDLSEVLIGSSGTRVESTSTFTDRYNRVIQESTYYMVPWSIISAEDKTGVTIESSLKELATLSLNILEGSISGKSSFDEGLANYRIAAKRMGMQEYLDELNERLGKTSGQSY